MALKVTKNNLLKNKKKLTIDSPLDHTSTSYQGVAGSNLGHALTCLFGVICVLEYYKFPETFIVKRKAVQ